MRTRRPRRTPSPAAIRRRLADLDQQLKHLEQPLEPGTSWNRRLDQQKAYARAAAEKSRLLGLLPRQDEPCDLPF